MIVRHKFCPVIKEIQSDAESVSYFLLTAVFIIPKEVTKAPKTVRVSTVKYNSLFIIVGNNLLHFVSQCVFSISQWLEN